MLVRSELTEQVIGCAINVHKLLGPGLLESVYEECLCFELAEAGLPFKRQIALPIVYRDRVLDGGFRADIVVSNVLIIEIKSVGCHSSGARGAASDLPPPDATQDRPADEFQTSSA